MRSLALNAINKSEGKVSRKGAVRTGKRFILFISNEDLNDIKIIESLEDSNVLIDGVTGTLKQEIRFLPALLVPISHFTSAISNFFSIKRYKWNRI